MSEVTIDNFNQLFENIKVSFKKARFITIDTEFSALNISEKTSNSLFDTPVERYDKLRTLCQQIIPMQIGISAFTFNPDENSYLADTYTFYVFPRKFNSVNPTFVFKSGSLQFLCTYNFDFNKFVYKGLPYLNRAQELEVKNFQNNIFISREEYDLDNLLQEQGSKITRWLKSKDPNKSDKLILPGIISKFQYNLDTIYYLHIDLRERFNKQIWTAEENDEFVVRRVTESEFDELARNNNLDKVLLDNLLGFTHVFRLLISLKKPIIGHNLLTDLMIIYQHFENPLPKSYKKFKKEIHELFPAIYDTKSVSFELKRLIPENKAWDRNSLSDLYNYFKDGFGRHIALNSPLIQMGKQQDSDQFHNAGWDSYCTGYIFIRMAHFYATKQFTTKSKFMSSELCSALNDFKNCVNVIRCSVSYIKLDGNDPDSRRPPCLIVESTKRAPLNLSRISSLLNSYGFVEIKPYSKSGRCAIVAVDNFGSARRILKKYKSHDEFQVKQYNMIKHSPLARAIVWSGIVSSGAVLAWLGYTILKN